MASHSLFDLIMFLILIIIIKIKPMGPCVSSNKRQIKRSGYDEVPQQTKQLKGVQLPKISFSVLLSDIKLKKHSYKFLSLRFKIDNMHEYSVPTRQIESNQKIYWKISHTFDFLMTEYEIRNAFLEIQAYGYQKELVGTLRINLYVLWTGPYHIDFNMPLKEAKEARISLNAKISQGVMMKIQNIETQMIIQDHQMHTLESEYTYSFETIIGQQTEISNCPYIVHVKSSQKDIAEKVKKNCLIETQYVAKNNICWLQKKAKELFLPKLQKSLSFFQIYSSSLHLTFFRVLYDRQTGKQPQYETESECYISFSKLMSLEYFISVDPVSKVKFQQQELDLLEKIWFQGKEVGKVKLKLNVKVQQHQQQMQTCVRTQEGILASSPVFSQPSPNSKSQKSAQIQKLKKISTTIQNQFINFDINARKGTNVAIKRQIIRRINDQMTKMLQLLQKTYKQSILFYEYKNHQELYSAQRYLIDLAFNLLSFVRENKEQIKSITWKALTTILKRGQFQLQHIGFNDRQKDDIASHRISPSLKMKVDVCLKYQQLLNCLLSETLILLQSQGGEAQMAFAESFCAYAYFRIPLFRQHIMSAVIKKEDPQIAEWRGTQVNINQSESSSQDVYKNDSFYSNLLDWEHNFYRPISQQQKYKKNNNELQNILLKNTWKTRLQKRGGAFYTFFENLMSQIEHVCVVSKHLKWHCLPGYNKLLHAFLIQMKGQKIKDYTQRFKNCCLKLLSNAKLLNIFVVLLLKKTNLHQKNSIQITFNLLQNFLYTLKSNQRPIPATFDYKFLLEGMKIILQSQREVSITKVLAFIYHHFKTFSTQFLLELSLFLISRYFFKFFFHWSYTLRYIYHYLLYAKILKITAIKQLNDKPGANKVIDNSYNIDLNIAIKQRYTALMNVLQNEIKSVMYEHNENTFYEKTLYKKMSINLKEKKRLKEHPLKGDRLIPSSLEAEQIVLPSIRSKKSIDNASSSSKNVIIPNKLLYFKDSDMNLIPYKDSDLHYISRSLSQYKNHQSQMDSNIKMDPKYEPLIEIKERLDKKQISPSNDKEW